MATFQRYAQPQRMGVWSCRIMAPGGGGVLYARDIVPIVAKSKEHAIENVWKVHQEWLIATVPAIAQAPPQSQRAELAKHADVTLLTDGIWGSKDYVPQVILTPFG